MLEERNQFWGNDEKSERKEGKETWYNDLRRFCSKKSDENKELASENSEKDNFHPALLAFQEKERTKEIIID